MYSNLLGCCLSHTISNLTGCCTSQVAAYCALSATWQVAVHLGLLPVAHYQQPDRLLYISGCCLSRTISNL